LRFLDLAGLTARRPPTTDHRSAEVAFLGTAFQAWGAGAFMGPEREAN